MLRRIAVDVRPLGEPAFRRLFVGQGVSWVGFQLTAVAVPVQMYDITGRSSSVGLLGLAGLVPLVLFGLFGGAVADAVDRRRLLVGASLVTWAATLGLLAQALAGARSEAVLLALTAVQSAGFATASPTRGAIVPRLLPMAQVPAANTLTFTVSSLGAVAGPLLAGVVLVQSGYAAAYALDAVLFTAALHAAWRLPSLPPQGEVTAPGWRSVRTGLVYIVVTPVLLMSFAVDVVAMVLAMPRALFPQAADEWFGGAAAVGWLYASIALGAVVGGLVSGGIGRVRRVGVTLTGAIVVWGLAVAASGLSRVLWLTVALLAVAGAADLLSAVLRQTILQTYAPDVMRGRLQGVFTVIVAGGPRLGDVRAGWSEALFGLTWAWVGGGLLCAVIVVLAAVSVPTFLRYDGRPPSGGGGPDR